MTIDTRQTVIAGGGPNDYLEARHAVLRGTNREIGRAIGEIARTEFDSRPLRAIDPSRARATRRYFREHYPIHEQRLLGAADAYGIAEGDEAANFVGLPYLLPPLPGCSVAYIPPTKTANGGGLLTRNLDFPLEFGAAPPDNDRLAGSSASQGFRSASRPYLFEVYPDEGYPSLYFTNLGRETLWFCVSQQRKPTAPFLCDAPISKSSRRGLATFPGRDIDQHSPGRES